MPVEVVMPKLGLTMASGTIARWIKQPGEAVRAGEPLVEVSTDKINYEVESPATGTMARALGNDGDEFACGDVIGLIALAGESDTPVPTATAPPPTASSAPPPTASSAPAASPTPVPLATSVAPDTLAGNGPARIVEAPRISAAANGVAPTAASAAPAARTRDGGRVVASPAARRLARERGVALGDVRGTGPRGRITMADVALPLSPSKDQGDNTRAQGDKTHLGDNPNVTLSLSKGELPAQLPPARRAIYRKMTEVGLLPLAQVATTVRVDEVRALIERRGDFGWTAFAVFAIARLLRDHPELRTNATTGAPFSRIDIGVAADTPHGLIVPVVHAADTMPLAAIHAEIVRLAAVARTGALTHADVAGACFSISNVGPQRVERVTPLPDPPQTAILGIGAVTQRPAVVPSVNAAPATIEPAWMLDCILSFDHRFIDGAPAARFLAAFARACTTPGVLL